jgi:glycosyltransferase involved in cell wall biosynthesis
VLLTSNLKNFIKKIFPASLNKMLADISRQIDERIYRHKLEGESWLVSGERIYLNYAGGLSPDKDGIVHGGRVKLIHLAEKFPEQAGRCNILYLVSSAVPQYAEILIKHIKDRGGRLVWNQNGVAYPAWDSDNYKTTNSKLSCLLHMADYVVYQSEFCRLSADRYLGEAKVPSKILYNPVDTELFSPAENLPTLDTWQLLVTGTHLQPDRVLLILKTLANLKNRGQDAKLTIAGRLAWPDGEKETLDAIKQFKLAGNVELIGAYTQDQAPGIYQAAHILFHIKYKDPCPTVPIEAMSCGVPVIGSLSGGMPELVSDEGGVLLEVPDVWDKMCYPEPEEIVKAVENIMSDLEGWRQKARQRAVSHFSKEQWLEEHHQIFTEVL